MIFDSWTGVIALFVLVLAISALPSSRPYAAGLLLPAVLLLLRKALLYFPVLGTISTEDKVIYWSTAAFFGCAISLLSLACIIVWIRKPTSWEAANVLQRIAMIIGVLGPWISAGILGATEWSIACVGVLSLVGVFKVLIVSPVLLPMAAAAILAHLLRATLADPFVSREINKLLLICVIVAGAVQFCAGAAQLSTVRGLIKVEEDWPQRRALRIGANGFPETWLLALPDINRCGVNLPLYPKEQSSECKISDAIKKVPGFSSVGLHIALLVAAALVVIAGAVERGAGEEEEYAIAGHSQ